MKRSKTFLILLSSFVFAALATFACAMIVNLIPIGGLLRIALMFVLGYVIGLYFMAASLAMMDKICNK